jgi:drug/metabolite transporter (DMT)-like permease
VLVYFTPLASVGGGSLGLVLGGITVCANSAAILLGRSVNRGGAISPTVVTATSMGVGAIALLAVGVAVDGLPSLSATAWLIIAWLAIVNTALAFTLWNRSLQHLTAVESSLINNTMLVQIAVLAWLFLGEQLGQREVVGLGVASVGIMMASLRPVRRGTGRPGGRTGWEND